MLIATKPAFPFSFAAGSRLDAPASFSTSAAGPDQWSGYSWELFDRFIFPIARDYGLNYTTYRIVPFDTNAQVLEATTLGLVDAGHAAITKTAQRSERMDFSTAWFDTGLAIMTRTAAGIPLSQATRFLAGFSSIILNSLALFLVAIMSMAIALFVLERAVPGPRPVMRRGCCSGVKDSAVLISLLLAGVEMRLPSGPLSRPAAAFCSVSSAMLTIVVTAIATVALQSAASFLAVSSFAELSGKTVVMPSGTNAETYVETNGVGVILDRQPSVDAAFARFASGVGDAMVYDKAILTSFAGADAYVSGSRRFAVVGEVFDRQQYGIALFKGLPKATRTAIDRAILDAYGSDEVAELRSTWLWQDTPSAASATTSSAGGSSVTAFLSDNFWAIAFAVTCVVGAALAVGLVAFLYTTTCAARRSGDCTISAVGRWIAQTCSGQEKGKDGRVRRRRQSTLDGGPSRKVPLSGPVGLGAELAAERQAPGCCGCRRRQGQPATVSPRPAAAPAGSGRPSAASVTEPSYVRRESSKAANPPLARHLLAPRARAGVSSSATGRFRGGARQPAQRTRGSAPDGSLRPSSVVALGGVLGEERAPSRQSSEPRQAWLIPADGIADDAKDWSQRPKVRTSVAAAVGFDSAEEDATSVHSESEAAKSARDTTRRSSRARPAKAAALPGSFSADERLRAPPASAAAVGPRIGRAMMPSFADVAKVMTPGASLHGGLSASIPDDEAPREAASASPTVSKLSSDGLTFAERLFLKREQWRMHRQSRLAPILPPNDLLWMIWERVDRLSQQGLLQRAMGRLDVPADLEEVSPATLAKEAELAAAALRAGGCSAEAAKEAAMVVAMLGRTEELARDAEAGADDAGAKGLAKLRAAVAARRMHAMARRRRASVAADVSLEDESSDGDDDHGSGDFLRDTTRRRGAARRSKPSAALQLMSVVA